MIAGLIVLTGFLALNLGRLGISAARALGYAYELDYGEGIVWQQMANIVAGHGYAPLGVFPAIVYHYPPVYHLAVAALAGATGLDPLLAGRLLSAVCTVATMVMIAWLALVAMPGRIDRKSAIIGAVLGAASFSGSMTVLTWSAMMRVDMLASALVLLGLLLAATADGRTGRLVLAALASALAVYTKQTAIAGPAAIVLALWVAQPRAAWAFVLWCGGLGIAALVTLMVLTDGQFLNHVLLYNVNRFDPRQITNLVGTLAVQAITFALGAAGAYAAACHLKLSDWRGLRARLNGSPADFAALLALIYLALRIAGVPMILKSGARDNYLIDLYAILAVFGSFGIASVAAAIANRDARLSVLAAALALVGLPIQLSTLTAAHERVDDPTLSRDNDIVVQRIRGADRPVISDDMVVLRRAGKAVLFEPAIVAELAHAGRYDEAALADMVRRGDFALFVTRGVRGDRLFDERYNPEVADAIAAAYPRIERVGDLTLHLPR